MVYFMGNFSPKQNLETYRHPDSYPKAWVRLQRAQSFLDMHIPQAFKLAASAFPGGLMVVRG